MRKQILLTIGFLPACIVQAQQTGTSPSKPVKKITHNHPTAGQPKDTVPIVRAANTINNTAVIKLPNVVSIPAEAFRPSNENGNNGYYKIRRDGLGTLAGSGETINNSLVAPLSLPDGAVITKIEFNVLSLYPHGYFPHLKLVQRGLVNDSRQKGAYSVNTPVNKYSVNSMAMTTESGLLDVKTIGSERMSYKINNKTSSYFFEVMANKSDRAPVDVNGSNWPNDNYLFIWSVEVHYMLD